MDAAKKQEFTRRITQSNRGGLVVILYDMADTYLADAKDAHGKGDYEAFKDHVHHADRVIAELSDMLDFRYPLAGELYPLYTFVRRELMLAIVKKRTKELDDSKRVLGHLQEAFQQAALQDTSEPLMQNAQQVYAGITYGKGNLTESCQEPDTSRGFLV